MGPVAGGPRALGGRDDADAVVGDRLEVLGGPISRPALGEHDLQRRIILGEQRGDEFAHVRQAVEHRNDNRDKVSHRFSIRL